MNRLLVSIIKKEFRHILRDPQTLWIVLVMPVVMLFLYGYAITLEMKQIEVAISDYAKTVRSRQFIEHLRATDFFRITAVDVPATDFERIFKERKARCILVLPADFDRTLNHQTESKVQLLVDATDPNAANYIQKYLMQIGSRFTFENNRFLIQPFVLQQRIFYNPLLKAHNFFVPGLIAIILLMISALLTSITIVREKEMGTMEQILVSPVRPLQIIIGKVIPYTILAFFDGLLIVTIGYLWFKVPINGSLLFLAGALVIYILTGLSFGLLVSTVAESQRTAMMAAQLATILPTIMLSGFIFPVASMPEIFRYLSLVIPATHFLEIIRGILLKGNTFADLSGQVGYLLLITLILIAVSVKKFQTKLE